MLYVIAFISVIAVLVHISYLLMKELGKSADYNRTIYLYGGENAGKASSMEWHQIIDGVDDSVDTVFNTKEQPVTSAFSYLYIRLYQPETGRCYDAYLENTLQIGRSENQTGNTPVLIIDDPMVSKKHCMLYRRGESILISDLQSTNHTYVNGSCIQGAVPITHGDHLVLGGSQYQFQCYYQG